MQLNRKDLDYGSFSFRRAPESRLKTAQDKPALALDTETYQGAARLLCISNGIKLYQADIDEILYSVSRLFPYHLFCYNLRFDAQAILKMLPEPVVRQIIRKRKANYGAYEIGYIPKKQLSVSVNHHTTNFYDLAQFFEGMSLDSACNTFLNIGKTDFKYTKYLNHDSRVWKEMLPDIVRYCMNDAVITQKLAEHMITCLKDITNQVVPKGYKSASSVTKFFLRTLTDIPDISLIPYPAQVMAFNTYKGGRFECLKKGCFPDAHLYDIVSAYPEQIRNLVSTDSGIWQPMQDEPNQDALYGFYACEVTVPYMALAPIAYVEPGAGITYPVGNFGTYLTLQEIQAYSPYCDIRAAHGWEFFIQPDNMVYPYRNYIDMLFEKKAFYPKTDYRRDFTKRLMNSVYGSMYEKLRLTEENEPAQYLAGVLFNPVFAPVITANTRIKAFQAAMKAPNDTIALATDSVLFTRPISSFDEGKALGQWEHDANGETVVIRSGIYSIKGKLKTRGIMGKTTGLITPAGWQENIFTYLDHYPGWKEYPFYTFKPIQLYEAAKSKTMTIEDVNKFWYFKKIITLSKELKRYYPDPIQTGGEMFVRTVESVPLIVEPE